MRMPVGTCAAPRRRRRGPPRIDHGRRHLAEPLVGHSEHRRLRHRGMRIDRRFHFLAADILAATDMMSFLRLTMEQIISLSSSMFPGLQISVRGERRRRRRGIVPLAPETGRPAISPVSPTGKWRSLSPRMASSTIACAAARFCQKLPPPPRWSRWAAAEGRGAPSKSLDRLTVSRLGAARRGGDAPSVSDCNFSSRSGMHGISSRLIVGPATKYVSYEAQRLARIHFADHTMPRPMTELSKEHRHLAGDVEQGTLTRVRGARPSLSMIPSRASRLIA